MAKQPSRKFIPRKKVFNYWSSLGECLPPMPNGNRHASFEECFACGDSRNLEVCHIIPRVFGGSDDIDNLHILCKRCHGESEGLKKYWEWLSFKRQNEWKWWAIHLQELMDKCKIPYPEFIYREEEDENNKLKMREVMVSLFWLA